MDSGSEHKADKGKIIVVEDEQSILNMLCELLTANDYR